MSAPEPRIRIRAMGSLSIRRNDDGGSGLTGVPALLFAYLADRRVPQPRRDLTALFWPDSEATRGRHGLRQALSRIRQTLGADSLAGTDPVGIAPERIDSDVARFEAALAVGDIERALELWRGPFLNGAAEGLAWELEEWVERRRLELAALLLDAGRAAVRTLVSSDDLEGALGLLERLRACVDGDTELALDAADLLIELGRPREAEVCLAGADLDASHPRAAGILKRAARMETARRDAAVSRDRAGASPDTTVVPAGAAPAPRDALDRNSPDRSSSASEETVASRRRRLAVLGLVAVLTVLGVWAAGPAPVPDATVHFCAPRETRYGFTVDLRDGDIRGVVTEPACPVVPLGADTLLFFLTDPDGGTRIEVQTETGTRLLHRSTGRIGPSDAPLRRAGERDGIVSPDGRWIVVSMERLDRPRPQDPALLELADEGPLPGVPGLRRDPTHDWDVVLLNLVTGEFRDVGTPGAQTREGRFTPDGDAVVYVSDETGNGDLYRHDLATGVTTRLTRDPRMARVPVVGRRRTVFMLGSATDGDPEDVAVLEHATGEVHRVHPAPWNQTGPDLSPDEERVCWTSKERGHWASDIAYAPAAGGGRVRVLESSAREDNCQWVGTDHILFRSWRTGDGDLFLQGTGRFSRARNLTHWDSEVFAPFLTGG